MNFKAQLTHTILLILFSAVIANPAMGNDRSDEAIALWVADRVGMAQSFEMPARHYVDKDTLASAFRDGSQQTFSRWQEEYGEEEARKILEGYLDNIVGLFNETTLTIYVADFIEPCRREAVFAHEMVHYFQNLMEGIITAGSYGESDERLIREMKAYHIQNEYFIAFCETDKGAGPNPEDFAVES